VSLGRDGFLSVGDGTMAARATRAWRANQGAASWCPRPQGQLAAGELAAAGEALDRGAVALRPGYREPQDGESARMAEGYAREAVLALESHGASQTWLERRFVVRSLRYAKAAAMSLRARVAQAQAPVEALPQRGRGRKRCAAVVALRQGGHELVQRHQVEACCWLRDEQPCTSRPVRAYRQREAGSKRERQATVEVRVDEEALERAVGRLGWRVSVTTHPRDQWSLEQAVLASRRAYLGERSVGRLKGRPLSRTPMDVQRDEHATGLMRLLSSALRV
jgi:hypothetical protein